MTDTADAEEYKLVEEILEQVNEDYLRTRKDFLKQNGHRLCPVTLKRVASLTYTLTIAKEFEVGERTELLCKVQWLPSQGMFRGNSWLGRQDAIYPSLDIHSEEEEKV